MSGFDVLGTMRAIRDDEALTTAQAHFLVCAVLRTNNKSLKVRYSLEGLARDSGLGYSTVRRFMRDAAVTKYFSKVERSSRTVGIWFPLTPLTMSAHSEHSAPSEHDTARCEHDTAHSGHPSTLSSTSSSTKEDADPASGAAPEDREETKNKETVSPISYEKGEARYSYSLREPLEKKSRAAAPPVYFLPSLSPRKEDAPVTFEEVTYEEYCVRMDNHADESMREIWARKPDKARELQYKSHMNRQRWMRDRGSGRQAKTA